MINRNSQHIHDQLSLLGSISNFHWLQYIRCDGKKSSDDIHVCLFDHILYHPSCEISDDILKLKYIPGSVSSRLLSMISIHRHTLHRSNNYHLSSNFKSWQKRRNSSSTRPCNGDEEQSFLKPKLKRKYSTHVIKVTVETLCNETEKA